ncbi:hypothetical protein EV177_002647 [Coemansia sp. RSA 1804]|nr:hypothetical protein EV177_002647 [Coemansia sp. RSA 1804]
MTTESILMLPSPPDSISVTPPPPVAEKPPAMLVDSLSQQNTPIIPFISNGSRLPVPTPQEDKEQGGKGDINTNGLASILENVFHIPSNAITINGKPITESNSITVGGKGQGSIVIVGGKGVAGSKNNDGDDDDDDDNDPDADSDNESTTTHMLDVDRVRNHGRIGSKIVDFDDDTISPSKQTDGNSSGSDESNDDDGDSSNSDDDSDEESDINGSAKSTSVTSSTSTLSATNTSTIGYY